MKNKQLKNLATDEAAPKLSEVVYCSLDIETSGFDPLEDEILEVGLVKFKVESEKFKVVEEWTKVFKPTKPVEAKILGLTGIKQEELDSAPTFADFKETIQEKVKDVCVVGHNVVFDIKFLESRGIKFSGEVIDTLDLVQWLLPTHHSYNLENLMHYFGIKHPSAHRALADAKATLEVLKKLLAIFYSLPKILKEKILALLKPFDFAWKGLLVGPAVEAPVRLVPQIKLPSGKLKISPSQILNFPLGTDVPLEIVASVQKSRKKILVVLPKKQQVVELWKKYGVQAVWEDEQLFDENRFERFIGRQLNPDEVKFALKILVWQATNWQTESLVDLNLSFFGGQFKQLVCRQSAPLNDQPKLLLCDLGLFLNCWQEKTFSDRQIICCGLAEFENAVALNQSDRVSWGHVNYILKSIYNPELYSGQGEHKQVVEELLSASDLFFGLLNALLQTDPPTYLDIAVTEAFKSSHNFERIKQAAENFARKLDEGNKTLQHSQLARASQNLKNFFDDAPNRVKWLELSSQRCALLNAPLFLYDQLKEVYGNYPALSFADALAPQKTIDFFKDRLGLSQWRVAAVRPAKEPVDLFTGRRKIDCQIVASLPDETQLLELVRTQNLPAALLFGLPKQLKEFYETNYQELKRNGALLAQSGSGGSNKLFNNFSINPQSLLVVTDRLILKALNNQAENSRPHRLKVKTLIILRLPFDPVSHPYNQALAATYPNAFEAMSLPKALYNFHQLVSFFLTPELKSVHLFDPKLNKGYAQEFVSYLEEIKAL